MKVKKTLTLVIDGVERTLWPGETLDLSFDMFAVIGRSKAKAEVTMTFVWDGRVLRQS